MAYTIGQIEQIAAKLRELPPIERQQRQINKQEAVRLLAKEIQALRQRGYTLEQIAEALRGEGLELTTQVLKNYLQRPTSTRKANPKALARKGADTPAPTPAPAPHPTPGGFTIRPDREKL